MHAELRRRAHALVATTAAAALLLAPVAPSAAEPAAPRAAAQPNIVLIMTDDMRADDLAYMPLTRSLLGQLDLTDFASNHPLCCPARAELLTGQFGHHNGVIHNGGEHGDYQALREKDNTLASWLHDGGYTTAMVGKFMNGWWGWDGTVVPRGWDHFDALVGSDYHPYDYGVYAGPDAEPERPGLHTNDFVSSRTVQHIKDSAGPAPFFIWSSYVAPHTMRDDNGKWQGAVPAERHRGMFARVKPAFHKAPSWERVVSRTGTMRQHWRQRVRSLQSVDEGVRDTVAALDAAGELEDTVVVFTSDNGFLLGEHGVFGKNQPYEETLRVPLLARGPGVATGASAKGAMMTDIAPSLAALAGVEPGRPQDGRSDLFAVDGGWRQLLIQGGLKGGTTQPWWWRGVRERKWVYVRWADRPPMLYNRRKDPYQVTNLAGKRPAIEKRLRTSLPEVKSMRRTRTVRVNTARAAEPYG